MVVHPVSCELAASLLRLDAESGRLYWRHRRIDLFDQEKNPERTAALWNGKFSGKEAFTAYFQGYRVGRIFDRLYRAHRLVWLLHTGSWPEHGIDHINGTRDDNRPGNLRAVDQLENMRNQKRRTDNTSGVTGVCWFEQTRKWQASIHVRGKSVHLGYFDTLDEAAFARSEANMQFGFAPRHGAPL